MTERIRNMALVLLAGMILFSCSGGAVLPEPEYPGPGQEPGVEQEADMVYLSLSVAVNDISRAARSRAGVVTTPDDDNYFEEPIGEYEKMQSLRVIILRPGGNGSYAVEQNHYMDFEAPGVTFRNGLQYNVRGGENKMLYLIANEKITGYDFDALTVGTECTSGFMEAITFGPASGLLLIDNRAEPRRAVPMSESYHFYVPQGQVGVPGQNFDAGTLFLTRAAVKFTFNVSSAGCEGLSLKSITFGGLSSTQYLLPKNTTYVPAKLMPDLYSPVASPGLGELGGRFITSYTVPGDAKAQSYSFDFEEPYALNSGSFSIQPQMYFCESQYAMPYTVGVTLTGADGYKPTFEPQQLPNLPILPRNTHVVVNMNITPHRILFTVSVEPWYFGGRTEIMM